MRRSFRRPKPYKSPRLFSMVALLVCLVIMMNSLNSMRGPGANGQRIISNLDKSIKLVATPAIQQSESQAAESQTPESQVQVTESQVPETQTPESDAANDSPQSNSGETNSTESNVAEGANLNLREDLKLQDWLGLVQDGALKMQKLEMPAYWRIMSVVKNTPFSELQKAADSKWRFNDLYLSAAKNRSKLIAMTVNIRKISRYETEENAAGVDELFEVWGWSDNTKSWLYVFVTPELPPGLDANTPVNQTATFAGYFFKLQGYHPALAKPNMKPTLAPMLIGKFELSKAEPRVAANPVTPIEMIIGVIVLIVGVIVILLRIFVFGVKKPKLKRAAPNVNFAMFPDVPLDSQDQDAKG